LATTRVAAALHSPSLSSLIQLSPSSVTAGKQSETLAATAHRESRISRLALLQRLPVTALSAPAAENSSFAQGAFVSADAFHRSGIQRAKCVDYVIECYGFGLPS
jgi:hypothetical protein